MLYLVVGARWVVNRCVYAYVPKFALGVVAPKSYFATNLHHVVFDSLRFEVESDGVYSVALGYGAAVEHGVWVVFDDVFFLKFDFVHADERHDAVYGSLCHLIRVFKSESPKVYERCDGDVEGSVCLG